MPSVLENRLDQRAQAQYGTPSYGDYGSTIFNVGGAEAAAALPAIARWGTEGSEDPFLEQIASSAKYLQDALHSYSEGSFDQLSPAMKERLTADILTSDEFWQHPISTLTAQSARTLPTMAASGLGMLFSGGGLSALATAAAVGGVQGMGQSIDAMQRDVDTRPDTELKQLNPVYRQLRADGISEATARKQISQAMIGAKPLAIFAVSAVTSAFGPETQALRALGMKGLGKAAEGGIARRVGKEFGQGALSEGIEETNQQAFQEQAAVDAGFQPSVNWGRVAQGGISGAAIGGFLGAPAGIRRGAVPAPRPGSDPYPDSFRRPDTTDAPLPSDIAGIDPFTGDPRRSVDYGERFGPPRLPPITADYGVQYGPPSMPPRGSDTQGTVPIVPDATPSPVPGGTTRKRNSKKGAVNAVPTSAADENAPTVTGNAKIVVDAAQVTALDATTGRTPLDLDNIPRAPFPEWVPPPEPDVTTDSNSSPVAGTMPAPGPTDTVAPAAPSEDMGAGTTDERYGPPRLPPVTAEYEQTQDYPRQPRTADGRRVLDTVPDQATLGLIDTRNEQLAARNARLPETTTVDTAPAPVAGKALPKGKDTKRNAKTVADDVKAQTLLGERPREMVASSIPEFRKTLQNIIGKAGKLGINIKTKVGYDTTPDSLVWLAEAKALFKKLNLKGISTQDKTDAINTFLDGEQQLIHKGHAEAFRSERAQEGAAQKQGVYAPDENAADTSVGPEAPVKAVGVRGTDRPGLGIESYSEEHNLPQKEGGEERDTRQQSVQRDVSKLSPEERAALIAEKSKPPTESSPKAGPKTKKALSAAQKNKQQREADKKTKDLETAKAVAKGLPKQQAEAARKAADEQEAARLKETKAKEAADTETAIKQLMAEKKLTKKAATAIVKGHAKERQQKEAAAAKAQQAKAEAERTAVGPAEPATLKAIRAIQTAEKIKARAQAEKQARTEAAAAKRTPFGVLKAQTRKAKEAAARAFKPIVRTKLEIARSLAARRAKRPTLTLPTKLRSLQALSSPQVNERLFGKKKLQAEKKKVEEDHSPAKHEADNFTKGHVSIEGVPVSIETKAGFGSIPGTVDTNGKPVKVLLGEGAVPGNKAVRDMQVAVIDQVDPDTRALTSHVVLYGFDDIQAAVNEFDGNFPDQMGDFAVMSHDELQRWIKSKENSEPVGVPKTDVDEPQSMDVPPGWDTIEIEGEFHNRLTPEQQQRMTDIVRQVAGDVKVEFQESFDKQDSPGWGKEVTPGAQFLNRSDVDGTITERLIRFAMNLQLVSDKAAFHEAWHAIERALGRPRLSLLAKEMPRLRKIAQEDYMMSEADAAKLADSEVLAIAFARWANDKPKGINVGLRRYFKAVHEFLKRLGNAIRGLGFRTAEDIFGEAYRGEFRGIEQHVDAGPSRVLGPQSMQLLSRVTDHIPERFRPAPEQDQMSKPWLLWIRSLDQIAQLSKQFGPAFYKHVRAIADTLGRIDASAKEYLKKWVTTVDESLQLEREYNKTESGKVTWNNYQNVMHDERSAGAWAHLPLEDQPDIVKDPLRGAYARARMPDLYARWNALPDDLKAMRMKTLNFYAARQNEANERNLRNILRADGHTDPALIQRIFNGTETEADKALLGPVYDHITNNEQATRIKGPYYPFVRRGDHVVRASYKITTPRRFLREIPNEDGNVNTWEFDTQKMAMDYAATQTDLYPTATSVWVDGTTGERFYTDADGVEQRVKASDPNSVQRFRVSVENRYVEFFPKNEALRISKEMESDPNIIPGSVLGVEERPFQPQNRQLDLASYKMQALADTIKKRPSFKNLSPTEQNEVEGVLMEASLRMLPHTRIQTRYLPFNHIQGASRDSTRAMMEHAQQLSGFMARMDHQQDLNEAIAGMMKEKGTDAGKSLSRSHIANHVMQRVNNAAANPPSGFMDGAVKRLLITSFLARLVSPATDMINMLQPVTTTLPMLASRHGPGRASREMLRVYKLIGTGRALKTGIVATGRALKQGAGAEHPTLIEDMMVGMNANQIRMVKELIARNIIDPDVGIEVSLLNDKRASIGGFFDRMLDYLQRFARQMPRTIEAINRVVTATAAYNLEMEKSGGNHEESVNFAAETTSMTQGVYSRTNAAPVFNHPLGRITFQFKQYAQLIYGLIGGQIDKAYRNAEPGDRAEALKTLGYMTLAYTAVAGTMGLPTEPIKLLLMAAAPLGLPFKWEDFEHDEREFMASVFGQQIGEIITHGISRALPEGLSFDLSSRVGIQDLLLFGEPRSQDQQDVKAYAWDVVAGAPGALVKDWFLGTQDLLSGDVLGAAEKLNPVKVGADLVKSYRMATEGKRTGAGYQSLSPYSLGEAAIRTFGFTPSREAEAGEASRYFYAKQTEAQGARGSFLHQWVAASGSERGKLWGQIERYNASRENDEKITRADLDRYARSRVTIESSRRSGLRLTRREKSLYKDITGVYNIQ